MNFQIILLCGLIYANNAANFCESDNCPIKCKDLKGPLSPKIPKIICSVYHPKFYSVYEYKLPTMKFHSSVCPRRVYII